MKNEKTIKSVSRVAVGMSGGVDSSVSTHLLKEQGYEVTGVFMQCWDEKADGCRADEDRADAAAVAAKLEIEFVSLDFRKEYKARVIEHFYKEYEAGRTPNPDVMCNKEIKFGLFLDWANDEGFDFVATGHYTRVENGKVKYGLLKGIDETKDQSYFLYLLGQKELSKVLFPLGEMKKDEVRKIAKKIGLHNANKPDSVGICFIGEVNIKDFLKKRIDPKPGNVINTKGEILGKHDGVAYYTVGQRHGFEITKYVGLPLYVIDKDVEKDELIVGFAAEANRENFFVQDLHWISGEKPDFPFQTDVRIRHLGEFHAAKVVHAEKSKENIKVELKDPVFGVAPGQSAVFYDGDIVLGGGVIV